MHHVLLAAKSFMSASHTCSITVSRWFWLSFLFTLVGIIYLLCQIVLLMAIRWRVRTCILKKDAQWEISFFDLNNTVKPDSCPFGRSKFHPNTISCLDVSFHIAIFILVRTHNIKPLGHIFIHLFISSFLYVLSFLYSFCQVFSGIKYFVKSS